MAKSDRIVPVDLHDRMLVCLRKARIPPRVLWAVPDLPIRKASVSTRSRFGPCNWPLGFRLVPRGIDELPELPHSDMMNRQVKRPGNPYAVLGLFILNHKSLSG